MVNVKTLVIAIIVFFLGLLFTRLTWLEGGQGGLGIYNLFVYTDTLLYDPIQKAIFVAGYACLVIGITIITPIMLTMRSFNG